MINVPEVEDVKRILREWVSHYPRINRIYLFGSYVTEDNKIPSDIDIAITIDGTSNDTALSYWCIEGEKLQNQLKNFFGYKVHLEWFDARETPTVKQGLDKGCIMVYERG